MRDATLHLDGVGTGTSPMISGEVPAAGRGEGWPRAGQSSRVSSEVLPLLTVELRYEEDVVTARQRARQVAELLGFDGSDQTRIATAVSELARNAYEYAGGGWVSMSIRQGATADDRASFLICVSDNGPGIADVEAVLDGRFVSTTGMGVGIVGARRLSESFQLDTAKGRGTRVEIGRYLPSLTSRVNARELARLTTSLVASLAKSPTDEVREQNRELLRALDVLRTQQIDIDRLNVELAETNRGVLALYTELDERAKELKLASEYKSRFLSDMSHELRTPLTSVLNMTRFLLARSDGDLTPEQERQVSIIRKSVESLAEMVNDLLDLAKIEAGRISLQPSAFSVAELFGTLRGVFRPLLPVEGVSLVFDVDADVRTLYSDELRVSQVLRNFISNAIKFTEAGEINVRASCDQATGGVRFAVRDSGIGIAPENHELIFHDFTQVEGPVQRRVRGTGLGLPLSKKLARLLGGHIELVSAEGEGSTFSLVLPFELPADRSLHEGSVAASAPNAGER